MTPHGPPDASAFADSLGRLEAQIAAADASGDPIPPEARQMATKLRELVDALNALTAGAAPDQPDDPIPPSGDAV
jgi:hypothetical protein